MSTGTVPLLPGGRPLAEGVVADAAFWQRQCQAAVPDLNETINALTENRDGPFIEIGLGQALSELGKQKKPHCLWLSSLDRSPDEWQLLLASLAEAYVNGIDLNWARLDESISAIAFSYRLIAFNGSVIGSQKETRS